VGALGSPAALWTMFRFRHRQTRASLGDA
jgi:ligand-binding SRPBCC domain-containing protein